MKSYFTQDEYEKLKNLAILPDFYDENLKTIRFDAYSTSLMRLKKNKYFKFSSENILHIFVRLLEFVIMLSEKGYCHSDLKPQNVVLVHDS
jgi:serine/threonine protein kinase